jgi:hypothetical protein
VSAAPLGVDRRDNPGGEFIGYLALLGRAGCAANSARLPARGRRQGIGEILAIAGEFRIKSAQPVYLQLTIGEVKNGGGREVLHGPIPTRMTRPSRLALVIFPTRPALVR